MEVHRVLGSGFLEPVYQEALEIEFLQRGIAYKREAALQVHYKDQPLTSRYRPDFVCFNTLIVELKALANLGPAEKAQVINYLKITGAPIGLLLNFGAPSLQYQRIALTAKK